MAAEVHPDIRRTLLFFVKDKKILLAMKKRGFGAGKWNGVGGKIEAGESIEDALVRESVEEVGVKPLSWGKVAELDFVQDATTDPWHMYVHVYISEEWEGEPTESEEMKPQWYPTSNIPYEVMWEDDQYWLQRVLDGEKLNGKFTFDEHDKLISHELVPHNQA
jgi:ADP-ribose pyrophosphatase YjhB (NUDIX family)